ncbi:TFIIB-type zinc ribbon-containing protein [Methanobrevibacter sp.]|uniref:TFIIB-type zinc ribbon-containing protein n=1 Tax=Methanobrevibacter sp. TaxID=66852 RepID=UPI0038705570
MKHAARHCPFCKTSDYTLFDEFRGEVFCEKCGLVFHGTNSRNSVVKLEEEARKKELSTKKSWNKKISGGTHKNGKKR